MDEQKYLIERLNIYDSVFEVLDNEFIKCTSNKPNVSNFLGEYAKEDLGDTSLEKIGEFSSEKTPSIILPFFKYKSHNRFIYEEKGYVKCQDTDGYVVLLKNALTKRLLWLLSLLILFFISFSIVNNIIRQNGPKLGTGGELPDSSIGILVPVFKEITLTANKLDQDLEIENPMENDYHCEVSIILNDGTLIYKSEKLLPNQVLNKIKLKSELKAQTYENTKVTYQYYKEENGNFTSLFPANITTSLKAN